MSIIPIFLVALVAIIYLETQKTEKVFTESMTSVSTELDENAAISTTSSSSQLSQNNSVITPIDNAISRITKKPFGIKVSPQDSLVQPERFSGYHTGTDFETFENEKDKAVIVSAICSGEIIEKRKVQGYGGIIAQSCTLKDQQIIVLYGHIKLGSIKQNIGDILYAGENFAILGTGYSNDTGGERKHLHLGIIKGTKLDLRGYVQSKSELDSWIDFAKYL